MYCLLLDCSLCAVALHIYLYVVGLCVFFDSICVRTHVFYRSYVYVHIMCS